MENPTIIRLNIERFKELLAAHLDPETRQIVETPLAEAQANLFAAEGDDPSDPS
jgi:hypothetical protein